MKTSSGKEKMSVNSKQTKMRRLKAAEGTKPIPNGIYCYDQNGNCPYWDVADCDCNNEDEFSITQRGVCCGYCWFLEKGDHELKGTSLLFDQCKECGEKMDWDEKEAEKEAWHEEIVEKFDELSKGEK